jgi:hypothetical protein
MYDIEFIVDISNHNYKIKCLDLVCSAISEQAMDVVKVEKKNVM